MGAATYWAEFRQKHEGYLKRQAEPVVGEVVLWAKRSGEQEYRCNRINERRKDGGSVTRWVTWQSNCRVCGAEFECETGLLQNPAVVNCEAHRRFRRVKPESDLQSSNMHAADQSGLSDRDWLFGGKGRKPVVPEGRDAAAVWFMLTRLAADNNLRGERNAKGAFIDALERQWATSSDKATKHRLVQALGQLQAQGFVFMRAKMIWVPIHEHP